MPQAKTKAPWVTRPCGKFNVAPLQRELTFLLSAPAKRANDGSNLD